MVLVIVITVGGFLIVYNCGRSKWSVLFNLESLVKIVGTN